MALWVTVYIVLCLLPGLALCAFNAHDYLSRRSGPRKAEKKTRAGNLAGSSQTEAEAIALYAQFLVAPETALREARELLERRNSEAYTSAVVLGGQRDLESEFREILSLL